ncbi:MAG: neutral zinc metallopeptidase [Gemmatimonadota bacterium]
MLWKDNGRSSNLEDRRGFGGRAGLGIGGTAVLLILSLVFGRNFFDDVGAGTGSGVITESNGRLAPEDSAREEPEVRFVSFVFDDVQSTWAKVLPQFNQQYHDARIVLFRNATDTGCGTGQSAMGPFYCPTDEKVYIDLAFYEELKSKFAAAGDFAQAYVIAHELGHHVQHILGTDRQVQRAAQQGGASANQMSVKLELQADCFAGVWAHSTEQRRILQAGDVDEALTAAASVGDDRIQARTSGRVNPDSFTHGSAEQRASWFKRGLQSGDPRSCNTFGS